MSCIKSIIGSSNWLSFYISAFSLDTEFPLHSGSFVQANTSHDVSSKCKNIVLRYFSKLSSTMKCVITKIPRLWMLWSKKIHIIFFWVVQVVPYVMYIFVLWQWKKGLGHPPELARTGSRFPYLFLWQTALNVLSYRCWLQCRERESNYVSASLVHILSVSPYQQPEVQRSEVRPMLR